MADGLERRIKKGSLHAPEDWRTWLKTLFPGYASAPFSEHHARFWDWIWSIRIGITADPFVAIWPRGGAKSTSAELACVALGARGARKFVLYISETQDQANDHVANIASMLETAKLEDYYPKLTQKAVGKFGNQKGWRMSRLRCANGFSVVAIGLDAAGRGIKLEEFRPDFIVGDDLDGEHDTEKTTKKKITTFTKKLLPAGSNDAIVLFIQNLIHEDSIASQLVDGRADFLQNRIVSGPIPAINDFTYALDESGKTKITGGTASWEGQSLEICQQFIDRFGISAFMEECQQDVETPSGGIFSDLEFTHCEHSEVPELIATAVWVDPAVTSTDQSDSMGIQVDGLGVDDKIYRLYSWEQVTTPEDAIQRAIDKAIEYGATSVGIETDQGGDTWESVFARALDAEIARREEIARLEAEEKSERLGYRVEPVLPSYWPTYKSDKAGSGHGPKFHRGMKMKTDYERGLIVHVRGTHTALERALKRFGPTGKKPFDLVDAAYYSWLDLREMTTGDPAGDEDF